MKQNRKPGIHLHKTIARSTDTHKRKAVALRSMKVAAEIFAESVGVTGGHYFDHTGKEDVDILNYDYK